MLNYVAFMAVILASNVIQGITGFAGTILAMPPSLKLVGYGVAKPVLNTLGLFSGAYVLAEKGSKVVWGEVRRIVAVMAVGIVAGFFIRDVFSGREQLLYRLLGVFVVALALQGAWKLWCGRGDGDGEAEPVPERPGAGSIALLAAAGVVHGIFVCGGPLLIGYLTKRVREKESFRATISTVWIFLNGLILVQDILAGSWTLELVLVQLATIPFLLLGMFIGSKLCARMDQRAFLWLTYVLLLVSGATLLVK